MTSINVSTKTPARPASPEIQEEWTSERIRETFGADPDCLVMKLLELCETQAAEIFSMSVRIRECEKDFLSYSQTYERIHIETERLRNQLSQCVQNSTETREQILKAVGIHEVKKN
jgi:hypothetical protein